MAYNSSSVDDDRGDNGILELEEHGDLDNKPVYLLEHLATFTVNKESGIIYPADGMRKLLQLEKTTGIWSQKMQLCLDRQWVLIMDYESQVWLRLLINTSNNYFHFELHLFFFKLN